MTEDFFSQPVTHSTDLAPLEPRCDGDGCSDRGSCLRYLQRDAVKKRPMRTLNSSNEARCFYRK
jgi:hypothetical protein